MIYYRVFYGSWRTGDMVRVVTFGKYRFTTNLKEAIEKARETANETGRKVTVSWDIPTGHGLNKEFLDVYPAINGRKET